MVFKWQFALIVAFIAHRSSNINVPLASAAGIYPTRVTVMTLTVHRIKMILTTVKNKS
jgi:hypothetical protein